MHAAVEYLQSHLCVCKHADHLSYTQSHAAIDAGVLWDGGRVLDPGISNRLWLACKGATGSESFIAGPTGFCVACVIRTQVDLQHAAAELCLHWQFLRGSNTHNNLVPLYCSSQPTVRVPPCFVMQVTFLVNSAGHLWGYQTYDTGGRCLASGS